MLFFLLQIDWEKLRPENIFGRQILERTPAGLSLVYLIGISVLVFFLILSFFGKYRFKFAFEQNLSKEVKKKLTTTLANRSLRIWQVVFFGLAFFVYGFHVYWTYFADESNEQFQAVSYKDLRTRRIMAANLRGWMLDRSGKLGNALAYYKLDSSGDISRAFSLEREMAHILGTERGTPGLERTIYKKIDEKTPEAWEILTKIKKPEDDQRDVIVTIDRDLQAFVAQQLEGKTGAIVVLNPQTGDVLAMYSNPSFNLSQAQSLDDWLKLEGNKRDKPLLNRATREYYVPGSTFKTFTMVAAFRTGRQNLTFTSLPGGFVPFRGSRAITDANGGCEPPYGCTTLNIAQAFEASSNQYFSQMAVELGRERMRETAGKFGMLAVDTPEEALQNKFYSDIWNASEERIKNALALEQATLVTGKDISAYDLALEGMGQGYAGQMTPFQMALVASAPANLQGNLMKPRIEFNQKPEVYSSLLSPQAAAQVRSIMGLVTEGSGGTATRVFARVRSAGIRSGGKTGTAEKLAPVYDKKTGKLKTLTKKRRNQAGELEEYQVPQMYERTDSWYISIAPLENPQLAIAVVVEGGGYGASTAAPIAANIVLKARDLGLLGEKYTPKVKPTETKRQTKKRK
ncbi:MAG: penicillin-binding transpeptidase domain-containing protein [Pyrinomonadaceae bacterium]